jgi:hypothetical protein
MNIAGKRPVYTSILQKVIWKLLGVGHTVKMNPHYQDVVYNGKAE